MSITQFSLFGYALLARIVRAKAAVSVLMFSKPAVSPRLGTDVLPSILAATSTSILPFVFRIRGIGGMLMLTGISCPAVDQSNLLLASQRTGTQGLLCDARYLHNQYAPLLKHLAKSAVCYHVFSC